MNILSGELLVGDIVLLKSDSYVPADLLILSAADSCKKFVCDYSSLKGESYYGIKFSIR
jgi:magnesium-transporting ATPase (P-type)